MNEPSATALLLGVIGLLMAVSVVVSRLLRRMSVPVAFLFLAIGMVAGSEGLGGIAFENYALAFRLGTICLVLILFDGGLNTSLRSVKPALAPATLLATAGVLATAGLIGFIAHLLGLPWSSALLLGAVVSPTDAAAVFSVLRGSRVELNQRVATTIELESGLNDPLAVILTLALTTHHGSFAIGSLVLDVLRELALGLAGGVAIGYGGRFVLARLYPTATGLLPVFTVALAFAAFGGVTLMHGSGFLAAYTAGIVIGNGPFPHRVETLRTHDAFAWLGQVLMFVVLGLLSFPSRLLAVGVLGVSLGLLLAFVARPLSVLVCLLPFRYRPREIAFVGWVGLRGAVPIILATIPVLAQVPAAHQIFNVVFFIVVVNALIPGATVRWVTRRLGVGP